MWLLGCLRESLKGEFKRLVFGEVLCGYLLWMG